jgi:hypothetical protein
MEKRKIGIPFLVLCFLLISVFTVEGSEKNDIADMNIDSNGIYMIPKIDYQQLIMTVSLPNGEVLEKIFDAGTTPYFSLSDIPGSVCHDGSYTIEIRAVPRMAKKIRRLGDDNKAGLESSKFPSQRTLVQSEGFLVLNGSIVKPGLPEGNLKVQDVLHYDDVIITGSLCVGFDCANGESFGFDTIILKEHNLRIYFNDTSYTASYPTNSWRITINDSTNGGASYFSVDDVDDGTSIFKIEAGAPSNSLYVEDYGRVGLGTSTPVVELHIKDSDTPTLRLEQDSSGGWTAQTFDVAGNESNFFVRDATNGSKLPFRIQPSTPSSTLCLKSDGFVGIGTWSPAYKLEVETTNENSAIVAERTDGATNFMNATDTYGNFGTATNHSVRILTNSSWTMQVNTDDTLDMRDGGGYDGTWNPASSRELKENIQNLTISEARDALSLLNPVKYNYKKDKEEPRVGFIAEDVPELVAMNGRKSLGTVDIIAVLTKVVQEQQKISREQQKTIAELKKRIKELERK